MTPNLKTNFYVIKDGVKTTYKGSATKDNEIEFVVKTKSGVIKRIHRQKMKSFNHNFLRAMKWRFDGETYYTGYGMIDTNGDVANAGAVSNCYRAFLQMSSCLLGDDHFGIVVGTSNQAVALSDYNLIGKISHGTGTGQLTYNAGTQQTAIESYDANTYRTITKRTFVNNSAGAIIIKEVGAVMHYPGYLVPIMFARDIVDIDSQAINLTLNPTESLEITFYSYYSSVSNQLKPISQFFNTCINYTYYESGRKTDGTYDTFFSNLYAVSIRVHPSPLGSDWGIMVGSGNSAVTKDDYKLETLIAHGSGAGQLTYNAQSLYQDTIQTTDKMNWIYSRIFVNDSSGTITINEVGTYHYYSTRRYCFTRKLVTPIILLPTESCQILVEYETIL